MDVDRSFEHLLAELSGRLAGLPAARADRAIEWALERVCGVFGTDRAALFELDSDDPSPGIPHSWHRSGIEAVADGPPRAVFGWYDERLRRGETIRIDRIADLPDEAVAEREYGRRIGMRSHLCVSLEIAGRWVCALSTAAFREDRTWSDTDVERLRIVGQMLAGAVHRRNVEAALRQSLAEVHRLQDRLRAENEYLREEAAIGAGFEQIVGRSQPIREALALAAQVAGTSATVLLLGETGTGKELLARAIHVRSKRRERPLIKVNCAALPTSLVESELFGHEKGAFTGATASKPGRFEVADGGTLFLDEVGELPLELQAKLLRILQDGEFERVGGIQTRKVDVRLVTATNRDLERAIAEGRFRDDLYYRLSTFPIRLPPLRERREDIPLLVWDLIQHKQDELDRKIERVPERTMQALMHYAWPGNVRELGNVIERALILSSGPVLQLDATFARGKRMLSGERLTDVERQHLLQVLERCNWRINGRGNAADVLGMHPNTLRSRLRKLGLRRPTVPTHEMT